jgi:hypothetical protein
MKLALILLLLAFAPMTQAQTLWDNASVGMSITELRHAYPEAVEIIHEPTRRGGVSDYWQVNNIDIAGQPFTASFYFREHRLDSVILQPVARDPAVLSTLVETLRDALTQKYGVIASHQETYGELAHGNAWFWSKGGTTVSLEMISISKPISLQVRYDAKAAQAAKQL